MLVKLEAVSLAFAIAFVGCLFVYEPCVAQEKQTTEPIFRVPKIAKLPKSILKAKPNRPDVNITAPKALSNPVAANNADVNNLASTPDVTPAAQPKSSGTANPAPADPTAGPTKVAANPAIVPNSAPDKQTQALVPGNIANQVSEQVHPLDRAIVMAHGGLKHIKENVHDYTAILVKRERVGDRVGEANFMKIKIRNERNFDTHSTPFSVYMKFLKPRAVSGREVIWVKGANQNKLIAHETGLLRLKRFYLDPDGFIAMKGQRYPIYQAGLENLVLELIKKAERDRLAGECQVQYNNGAEINKRSCTLIEVVHPERKPPYEFHKAKVYIDNQLNIPVRYAAYGWPTAPGKAPPLLEEYTYINVKLNVGLTDRDFDPGNPEYDYPNR